MAWTAFQGTRPQPIGPRQADYYNLLVSGFNKGSLAIDLQVPDAIKNAENPWDPAKRPPGIAPHDVSYFKGHYYLYFGVVPVVALMWPFHALTGHDLPMDYAILLYSIGGFLVAGWLWLRVIRDHFPRVGAATRVAGMAAVGIAGGQLVLCRRIAMWELPIAAGYYYMAWMLASAYMATRSRRPWGWLAVAGASLGLAFGCRPTLVGGGAGLAALVVALAVREARGGWANARRRGILAAAAAGLPLGVIVAGLLAYNHARFGKFSEFGLNYQLSSIYEATARHFSLSFIPFNFSVYFLDPPQWGRYFPFLHPIRAGSMPPGYYGMEYVYGILAVCPLAWGLAAAAGIFRGGRGAFAAVLAATGLATTFLLLSFNTAAARYEVDFMPWWVWAGALGWIGVEDRIAEKGGRGLALAATRSAFAAAALFSGLMAFCASVEVHDILEFANPRAYESVSRLLNYPVALGERATGYNGGPVEMDVTFPATPAGSIEPLVLTGVSYQTDFTYVLYVSSKLVRFGYYGGGDARFEGPETPVIPGKVYHLRIETGGLYPPVSVLVDKGMDARTANLTKRWVSIEMDGVSVFRSRGTWHDSSPGSVQVGRDRYVGTYGRRFTGSISGFHRGSWHPSQMGDVPEGDLRMGIQLPGWVAPGIQPLVSLGHPGNADILGLRMLGMGSAAINYECWGAGMVEGRPISFPAGVPTELRIRLGATLRLDGSSPLSIMRSTIAVWQDGRPAFWQHMMRPLDGGDEFNLMDNTVGSSAMLPVFLGPLSSLSRDAPPAPWRPGPFTAVEMDLGGRGSGTEPLVETGPEGHADTLAIRWRPDGRAQLCYDHEGQSPLEGPVLAWDEASAHHVRALLPSLSTLDGAAHGERQGRLSVFVDGAMVWERDVPYSPTASSSVRVGQYHAAAPFAKPELGCVVLDLHQSLD